MTRKIDEIGKRQRAALERIAGERQEDFSNLSRVIGRNAAYIQQFIRRGSPRRLDDEDRRTLARYLKVPEAELGGPAEPAAPGEQGGLVLVPRYDVEASAGPGSLDPTDRPTAYMGFDPAWLRSLCGARQENLSIIRVRGDSMAPTLGDGDEIMVDRTDQGRRLEDGVHVLRRDDTLVVKRIAVHPTTRRVTVSSDNSAYPSWPDCEPKDLDVVGRVVWAGRRMS